MAAGKTILVHNGALGDMCLAWPAMLAIVRHAAGPVMWAGKPGYQFFLDQLQVAPATPELRAAITACYSADALPAPLFDATIFWFGLETSPLPPAITASPQLHFLPMVHGHSPPAMTLAKELYRLDIPIPNDAVTVFRSLFGSWSPNPDAPVLLFPGAGHPRKCWPLERYKELAASLQAQGQSVAMVLGPDEQEQGWMEEEIPTETPDSLDALRQLLLGCRAVVGNDSGPMHLAGLLGTPGVALFGPTSAWQWGPRGLQHLTAPLPCRPCTRTTQALRCPDSACMEGIAVATVLEEVNEVCCGAAAGKNRTGA